MFQIACVFALEKFVVVYFFIYFAKLAKHQGYRLSMNSSSIMFKFRL